jgi:uncharacterized membrane protein
MTHLLMFLMSVAGFAALALATERQQEELLGGALSAKTTRALSVAGWIALAVSLVVAVHNWGWGFGLVGYSGHTSLAAGLVYVGLVVGARTFARHSRLSIGRRQL